MSYKNSYGLQQIEELWSYIKSEIIHVRGLFTLQHVTDDDKNHTTNSIFLTDTEYANNLITTPNTMIMNGTSIELHCNDIKKVEITDTESIFETDITCNQLTADISPNLSAGDNISLYTVSGVTSISCNLPSAQSITVYDPIRNQGFATGSGGNGSISTTISGTINENSTVVFVCNWSCKSTSATGAWCQFYFLLEDGENNYITKSYNSHVLNTRTQICCSFKHVYTTTTVNPTFILRNGDASFPWISNDSNDRGNLVITVYS